MGEPAYTCLCPGSSFKRRAVTVHGPGSRLGGHVSHHSPFGEVAIEDAGAEKPDEVEHITMDGDVRWPGWEERVQKKDARADSRVYVW